MKFTTVDQSTCIACGACGITAPDVFNYNDEGIAYVLLDNNAGNKEIPEEYIAMVHSAQDGCPTGSIKVSTTPFNLESSQL